MGDVRLILDTDVIIAAMRSPRGASAALLDLARRGRITLLASVPLALEYESQCRALEHRKASGLSIEEVDIFIAAVIAMAEPVPIYFLWRPQLRDAGDEMVLEAAVNGRANALVTFNVDDFGAAPARFGLSLLLPRDALARIRP